MKFKEAIINNMKKLGFDLITKNKSIMSYLVAGHYLQTPLAQRTHTHTCTHTSSFSGDIRKQVDGGVTWKWGSEYL
jgi:hypothetical protein